MTDLEVELMRIMVKLVVQYEDGWTRIESALHAVYEVGVEMGMEHETEREEIIH